MNEQKDRVKQILSDDTIVNLYWDRNERAIEATDDKYGKYLYKIAQNILHNHLDSEECLNDTYLGTWNTIPPARPNAFSVFVGKIARNIAVTRFRKNSAQKRVQSEMTVSLDELDCIVMTPSVEEEYLIGEISKILSEYLRELPDRQEFVFFCRYYCSDYVTDIAKMLNVSSKTVHRDLAKIREDLKERLKKVGYFHE